MSDKTFRLLLVLLLMIVAVSTTVIAVQMPRQISQAQSGYESRIYSEVSDIASHVKRISRGTCINSTICR